MQPPDPNRRPRIGTVTPTARSTTSTARSALSIELRKAMQARPPAQSGMLARKRLSLVTRQPKPESIFSHGKKRMAKMSTQSGRVDPQRKGPQ